MAHSNIGSLRSLLIIKSILIMGSMLGVPGPIKVFFLVFTMAYLTRSFRVRGLVGSDFFMIQDIVSLVFILLTL